MISAFGGSLRFFFFFEEGTSIPTEPFAADEDDPVFVFNLSTRSLTSASMATCLLLFDIVAALVLGLKEEVVHKR